MKLKTLKPRLPVAPSKRKTATTRDRRITGRTLQERRLRIWSADPKCAGCGRFTMFPQGFELDHKTPLFMGGADTDENCQVLCVEYDVQGRKIGCHAEKSAGEAGGMPKTPGGAEKSQIDRPCKPRPHSRAENFPLHRLIKLEFKWQANLDAVAGLALARVDRRKSQRSCRQQQPTTTR